MLRPSEVTQSAAMNHDELTVHVRPDVHMLLVAGWLTGTDAVRRQWSSEGG